MRQNHKPLLIKLVCRLSKEDSLLSFKSYFFKDRTNIILLKRLKDLHFVFNFFDRCNNIQGAFFLKYLLKMSII